MVSLLSRGVGGLLRSVVGYCCVQTNSNVLNGTSGLQCTTLRWFSKKQFSDDQPKRPMTAYFRFCVEKRPTFVKHHPGVKNIELTKMIALEWKGLPDSVKETYKAESRTEMLKYKEEMEAYRETLTPVQIEMQKEERRQRLVKRRSIQKKREMTVLGRPKRPRNAFNIYMAEHFPDAKGSSIQTKMKNLHEEWQKVHISKKKTYTQLAEDDKVRYQNEMKSWEQQMIEIGREDLVRNIERQRLEKSRLKRAASSSKLFALNTGLENPHRLGAASIGIKLPEE